jgi:putative tricarboxylic transport membrane protein
VLLTHRERGVARRERWLAAGLLLFAGGWVWVVLATVTGARSEGEPGPRAFPLLLGGLLAALALILLAGTLGRRAASDPPEDEAPVTRNEVWVVASLFALLLAYGYLLPRIGFLLATPLALIAALAGILGMRNARGILAFAFGFTLACHAIFNWLLEANLPRGSWLRLL